MHLLLALLAVAAFTALVLVPLSRADNPEDVARRCREKRAAEARRRFIP